MAARQLSRIEATVATLQNASRSSRPRTPST